MLKLPENAVPTYRLHKQSGQAIVTLSGRDFLRGRFGAAASNREYDRVVGEWVANGSRLAAAAGDSRGADPITVNELILAYWRHAKATMEPLVMRGDDGHGYAAAPPVTSVLTPASRPSDDLDRRRRRRLLVDDLRPCAVNPTWERACVTRSA